MGDAHVKRTLHLIETVWQDLRYGVRGLRRSPGFSLLAILTLGLGIGSVAVIYSVIDNVLLDPFPYADSQRMVDVFVVDDRRPGGGRGSLLPAEFLDYEEQSTVFEGVVGARQEDVRFRTNEGTRALTAVKVTPNTFEFLGVPPLLGRPVSLQDGRPAAPPVAALSHQTWQDHFGGVPDIIGRTIVLDDEPRTIVSVMPPRFTWHIGDVWIPQALDRSAPATRPNKRWFQARLKPGVTTQTAEAQLQLIAERRAVTHPDDYPEGFRMEVVTVVDWVVGRFRGVLYTLLAAVGLLLLIACMNVANMLLARATVREREVALRAALGASRARLLRQSFVESLVLSVCGAAVGSALAYGGIKVLLLFMPRRGIPHETQISIDERVLLFSLVTAAVAALLSGLGPALRSARRDLVDGLRDGAHGIKGSLGQARLRNGLVVAEIALALVLMVGAGLLMRSFMLLTQADHGFDPSKVVLADLALPEERFDTVEAKHSYVQQVTERVATLPGVAAAAATASMLRSEIQILGQAPFERSEAILEPCTEGYFDTLMVPVLQGRTFSPEDVVGRRRVAVVNRAFVQRFLPGQRALGNTVVLPRLEELPEPVEDPRFEIIGVVRDVRNAGPMNRPMPHVFLPLTIMSAPIDLVARTTDEPANLVAAMRREAWAADPNVVVQGVAPLEWHFERNFYAHPRFSLIVLSAFALASTLLVAIGVFAVIAYSVSQRSREIGLRMALGASRGDVLRSVLWAGARLMTLGIGLGLLGGLGMNRLIVHQLGHQLMDVSPYDPLALAAAVAIIVGVGALACALPARRAIRLEPMEALRHE